MITAKLSLSITALCGLAILGVLVTEMVFGIHGKLHIIHYELAQISQSLSSKLA